MFSIMKLNVPNVVFGSNNEVKLKYTNGLIGITIK